MSKDWFDSDGIRTIRSMDVVDITRIIRRIIGNDDAGTTAAGTTTATTSHIRRRTTAMRSRAHLEVL
jgi:hypothetical protein